MSDNTEKPKKLRLSRDKNQDSDNQDSDAADNAPKERSTELPNRAEKAKPTAGSHSTPESETSPEPKTNLKLSHHPDSPQAGSDGIEPPTPATDEAPSTHTDDPNKHDTDPHSDPDTDPHSDPDTDPRSDPGTDPAGQSNPLLVEDKSHSVLPSVLVVGLLFALLGGASYGLWRIVFLAEEPSEHSSLKIEENGSSTTSEARDTGKWATSEEVGRKNSIQRARETVEKARPPDIQHLTGEAEPAPLSDGSGEEGEQTKTSAPDGNVALHKKKQSKRSSEFSTEIEATKAAVSDFLATLHIGGMRQGARPMILIDGRAHNVGDTLQAETGLRFDGIRDGKLAFIDQNGIVYLKSF